MTEKNDAGEIDVERHHFAYFIACCRSFIDILGLYDWEVSFQYVGSDKTTPRASTTIHDRFNRLASIQLYDSWDRDPDEYNLWIVSFHEVIELLLSDLHCMAAARDFDYNLYDREHHRVIRMLENAWFKEIWKYGHEIFNFQSDAKDGKTSRPELPKLDSGIPLPNPKLPGKKRHKK